MISVRALGLPRYRQDFRRLREILAILATYGLEEGLASIDLGPAGRLVPKRRAEMAADRSRPERIRLAILELGPAAIKIGQILSTRPDLVGLQTATELEQLQVNVPPTPFEQVRQILEEELGESPEEVFAELEEEPLASASIGQVHRAVLRDGRRVVVKVQHPGIEETIRTDLRILRELARRAERVPEYARYQPSALVQEFRRLLLRELDFLTEARNMAEIRSNFGTRPGLVIPEPILDATTERVLTMECIEGISLTHRGALLSADVDLDGIVRRGADAYLEMIFRHGVYHADPHPGNLIVTPDGDLGILDFGMVGRLDLRLQEDFEELVMSLFFRDGEALTALILRTGHTPPTLDLGALGQDVADFVATYAPRQLDQFDLTGAFNAMFDLVRRHEITLPARIALLLKVLVILEGTGRKLSPSFNLTEVLQGQRTRMFVERLQPGRYLRRARRAGGDVLRLLEIMPTAVSDVFDLVRRGEIGVRVDLSGLEPSINRVVMGILVASVFLGSSLLMAMDARPLIFGSVSIPGLIGYVIGLYYALKILIAIQRSGQLGQKRKKDGKQGAGR